MAPGDRAKGTPTRRGTYVDEWGCLWKCGEDGVVGEVKSPPLSDWFALDTYKPPCEILKKASWDLANRSQQQNLSSGNPRFMHASTTVRPFERMQFLRGTEALLLDLAYGSSKVLKLLEMVHDFFLKELQGWRYCLKCCG